MIDKNLEACSFTMFPSAPILLLSSSTVNKVQDKTECKAFCGTWLLLVWGTWDWNQCMQVLELVLEMVAGWFGVGDLNTSDWLPNNQ